MLLFRRAGPVVTLMLVANLALAGGHSGGHYPPIGGGGLSGGGYYSAPATVTPAPAVTAASSNISFYYSPSDGTAPVRIEMKVPANAQVWFDGNKTDQSGVDRVFVTPPLAVGKDFTYDVRVEWTEDGRKVEQTRKVSVRAGDRATLNFLSK